MSKEIIDHRFGVIETRETFYTEETIRQKDKQIADLEAKLKSQRKVLKNRRGKLRKRNAEIDLLKQQLEDIKEQLNSVQVGEEFALKCCNEADEQLEKQAKIHYKHLEEKDKEIEELKAQRHIYLNRSVEECNKITSLELELQHKDQDKIEFAIAELEKVKEFCNQREKDFTYLRDEIKCIDHNKWVDFVSEVRFFKDYIDNQIKELKENK